MPKKSLTQIARRVGEVLGLLEAVDQEAAERVAQKNEEHARRLENNPIYFDSWEAFVRYRRSRGLRTRRPGRRRWLDR